MCIFISHGGTCAYVVSFISDLSKIMICMHVYFNVGFLLVSCSVKMAEAQNPPGFIFPDVTDSSCCSVDTQC